MASRRDVCCGSLGGWVSARVLVCIGRLTFSMHVKLLVTVMEEGGNRESVEGEGIASREADDFAGDVLRFAGCANRIVTCGGALTPISNVVHDLLAQSSQVSNDVGVGENSRNECV